MIIMIMMLIRQIGRLKSGDVIKYRVYVKYNGPYTNGLVDWYINALLSSPSYSDTTGNLIVNGTNTGGSTSSGTITHNMHISASATRHA